MEKNCENSSMYCADDWQTHFVLDRLPTEPNHITVSKSCTLNSPLCNNKGEFRENRRVTSLGFVYS